MAVIETPRLWANPSLAQNTVLYTDVEVQFTGTPGTPYTPVRSLDETNFFPCNAYDKDGNVVSSISVAGIYAFDGGGWLKFSAGAGSVLTLRLAT